MRLNGTKFSWLVLSAFAAAVTLPSSVFADGVPAAQFEVAAAGGTTILTAGTVSGTAFNGGTEGGSSMSTASASYSGGSASASGSGSTSGGVSTADSSGLGLVTFYFSVAGSAPGVTFVPLLFSGSVSTSATGPDAVGEAYFETPGGQINACSATGLAIGACGSLPASDSGTLSYNASPGDLYDIGVIAEWILFVGHRELERLGRSHGRNQSNICVCERFHLGLQSRFAGHLGARAIKLIAAWRWALCTNRGRIVQKADSLNLGQPYIPTPFASLTFNGEVSLNHASIIAPITKYAAGDPLGHILHFSPVSLTCLISNRRSGY